MHNSCPESTNGKSANHITHKVHSKVNPAPSADDSPDKKSGSKHSYFYRLRKECEKNGQGHGIRGMGGGKSVQPSAAIRNP